MKYVSLLGYKEAREGFCSQIRHLSDIERQTSIAIIRCVDLGKTALILQQRMTPLCHILQFCFRWMLLSVDLVIFPWTTVLTTTLHFRSSPKKLLESLENYLYVNKGFRRTNARHHSEPRALYLCSVWRFSHIVQDHLQCFGSYTQKF